MITTKFRLTALGYMALIFVLIMVLVSMGHCTTSQPRPNNLGVFQTYDSPWMYMVGEPIRVNIFEDNKGHAYTNVAFKALGASMLNTVEILFCGDEESGFMDGHLRAVTYHIKATRTYQGIGCHDILPGDMGVIAIEGEK